MAFDLNFRRLITGCEDGGVKVTLYCYASDNIKQLWLQQAIDHYHLLTAIRFTYCICCASAGCQLCLDWGKMRLRTSYAGHQFCLFVPYISEVYCKCRSGTFLVGSA